MDAEAQISTKILRRLRTSQDYALYRAGLEWDLTDPIVIESRDDLKSEQLWRDRIEPYQHQIKNLITFCRRLPVTLIADDVGLGKTISAGLVISELISRARISRILIVCPKILGEQWKEELLTKFGLDAVVATGKELNKAEPECPSAVITTYASARLHLERIPDDRFQMLVLDEAHKLRNLYGTEKAPQVATKFKDALQKRRFAFVLMLTATPLQNRLWDLYSLIELLTVARGHENPFGSEGIFARRFIGDGREKARQLRPEARDDFRAIVYSYMSRIRRGDANLYFPERVVQMHRVAPTAAELQLIATIAKPIQKMNRLGQISVLQALTSSPDALTAQLDRMAKNDTFPAAAAAEVRAIVKAMPPSAKLVGLGVLVDRLKAENPERWRLVVFTCRRETQTTIQAFLEARGLKVGIINGTSGARNQETIKKFRSNPPSLHVIVSTEAGSEGVNLQVANIVVNFDLPWNPMIVEQRIGRVQRLASEHAKVGIFNIILEGTFEEYIVARLMEKLQLASHAIGDIEALLAASGMDGGESEEGDFEEQITDLILAALAGKDIEAATKAAEQSIEDGKKTLAEEEGRINALLGSMDEAEYRGPQAPQLPPAERSMTEEAFTKAALTSMGAELSKHREDILRSELKGAIEYIRFEVEEPLSDVKTIPYVQGAPAFGRLVGQVIASAGHTVVDEDVGYEKEHHRQAEAWAASFGGRLRSAEVRCITTEFEGKALLRVRATVTHDSYDRLVDVRCRPIDHSRETNGAEQMPPMRHTVEKLEVLGINEKELLRAAEQDPGIAEFCRFYLERRAEEIKAAGDDERKRTKLRDEFTPRLMATVVGLEGKVSRTLSVLARYQIQSAVDYESALTIRLNEQRIVNAPSSEKCTVSGKLLPADCLEACAISGERALRELLIRSELSGRAAKPDYIVSCDITGQQLIVDETAISDISKRRVAMTLLKRSPLSGKRAEAEYFSTCAFTNSEVLKTELAVSDASVKPYRADEGASSAVSGKTGHRSEFISCAVTGVILLPIEAVACENTGTKVSPGVLETCAVTSRQVLPDQIERCAATGKRAIKQCFEASSVSGARILKEVAVFALGGAACAPIEAVLCAWSGRRCHPADIQLCELTGLPMFRTYVSNSDHPRLAVLSEMLDGMKRTAHRQDQWPALLPTVQASLRERKCAIEFATLSPDERHLAIVCEIPRLLGFKTLHSGFLLAIDDTSIVGRIVTGKRDKSGWTSAE